MIFLFNLFIGSLYLYMFEKLKVKMNFFSFLIPIYFTFLLYALQFDVGTDYFSYINIYNQNLIDKYYCSMELLFAVGIDILRNFFHFSSQSLFVLFAFYFVILFYFIFKKLTKYFNLYFLLFILFITSAGFYHNYFNTLRQGLAILFAILLIINLAEQRKFNKKIVFLSFFGILAHKSFLIFLFIVILSSFLYKKIFLKLAPKKLFILFLLSFIFTTLILPLVLNSIVITLFPFYKHYLYNVHTPYSMFITKIYFIPFFILFFYYYIKDYSKGLYIIKYYKFFQYLIFVFSLTWAIYFLMSYSIHVSRIFLYFQWLYIFPLYYLFKRTLFFKQYKLFVILFASILIPYILKVTVLAKGEFLYKSILFS